jgi:ethanolamine utilization microcompartment shell protein EutL
VSLCHSSRRPLRLLIALQVTLPAAVDLIAPVGLHDEDVPALGAPPLDVALVADTGTACGAVIFSHYEPPPSSTSVKSRADEAH